MTVRKSTLSIALILFLALIATGQEAKPAQGTSEPKLVIDATNYDFGTVKSGSFVSHTFKIKNEGAADLLIKNVAPS